MRFAEDACHFVGNEMYVSCSLLSSVYSILVPCSPHAHHVFDEKPVRIPDHIIMIIFAVFEQIQYFIVNGVTLNFYVCATLGLL